MAKCAQCSAPEVSKKCSACKQVWYCSKDCQKSHYRIHKKECAKLGNSSAPLPRGLNHLVTA